jgi:hypothetical protein
MNNVVHSPIQNDPYLPNNRSLIKVAGEKDIKIWIELVDLA